MVQLALGRYSHNTAATGETTLVSLHCMALFIPSVANLRKRKDVQTPLEDTSTRLPHKRGRALPTCHGVSATLPQPPSRTKTASLYWVDLPIEGAAAVHHQESVSRSSTITTMQLTRGVTLTLCRVPAGLQASLATHSTLSRQAN